MTCRRPAHRWLALALSGGVLVAPTSILAQDSQEHAAAAGDAARVGAFLPYGQQASLQGYRAYVLTDTGYDGVRMSPTESLRGEVVLLPGRLSVFAGGRYGAPDLSASPHDSGEGGVRVQLLQQARRGVDLSSALRYTSLGFNQLPALVAALALSRAFGPTRLTLDVEYGACTREGDRYGGVDLSVLVDLIAGLYMGADARARTDLERDHGEPEFEPQYEVLGSALLGYTAPWLTVQARAGARALQYRLQTNRMQGAEIGVSVATAL